MAAWSSLRHFPLFVIISLPWLAGFYRQSWGDHNFQPQRWPLYLRWFLIIALVLSTAAVIVSTHWTNRPDQAYCYNYPCTALAYLRQSPYSSWPALIDYSWGGYFYWQWTDKQIFIDGRLPQYQWRDRSLIEHYARFYQETDIKAALDDYDLAVVVVAQPQAIRFNWLQIWLLGRGQHVEDYDNSREAMRRAMLKLPNWRLVYSDVTATVYVRQ